jgi:hypothetical protein
MTYYEIEELLISGVFISVNKARKTLKENSGLGIYCIKLNEGARLINKYQIHLEKRKHKIINIGKTETQSLYDRLIKQELFAIGHGTFFRSIGTALGYKSKQGTLSPTGKNFEFSDTDTCEIVKWLFRNVNVNFVQLNKDFYLEKKLIHEIRPLLNYNHNPDRLYELNLDRSQQINNARIR